MEQNSSSDLYLDELSVWRIIRLDGKLVSSINSASVSQINYLPQLTCSPLTNDDILLNLVQ